MKKDHLFAWLLQSETDYLLISVSYQYLKIATQIKSMKLIVIAEVGSLASTPDALTR